MNLCPDAIYFHAVETDQPIGSLAMHFLTDPGAKLAFSSGIPPCAIIYEKGIESDSCRMDFPPSWVSNCQVQGRWVMTAATMEEQGVHQLLWCDCPSTRRSRGKRWCREPNILWEKRVGISRCVPSGRNPLFGCEQCVRADFTDLLPSPRGAMERTRKEIEQTPHLLNFDLRIIFVCFAFENNTRNLIWALWRALDVQNRRKWY